MHERASESPVLLRGYFTAPILDSGNLPLSGNVRGQDVEIKDFLRKKWVAYWQTYIIIN